MSTFTDEVNQLNGLVGKTIESIDYDGFFDSPITINFTDKTYIYIGANGDDAAHTEFEIGKNK